MNFEELIGQEVDFYGVDNLQFKINDTVYEAIEDPDDGWRSYLGSIEVVDSSGIFFQRPLSKVTIEECEVGYYFKDIKDDHVWLEIGTDYSDNWYPCFVFYYQPK